jgi:hypothetical protein
MPRALLKLQVCCGLKGNPSFNARTFPNFGVNLDSPPHIVRAFLHALEAEALSTTQIANVESDTLVGNGGDQFAALFAQAHASPVGATVSFKITKPFLHYSKETKSYVVRKGVRHTFVTEVNFYILLTGELSAQGASPENKSQALQR